MVRVFSVLASLDYIWQWIPGLMQHWTSPRAHSVVSYVGIVEVFRPGLFSCISSGVGFIEWWKIVRLLIEDIDVGVLCLCYYFIVRRFLLSRTWNLDFVVHEHVLGALLA